MREFMDLLADLQKASEVNSRYLAPHLTTQEAGVLVKEIQDLQRKLNVAKATSRVLNQAVTLEKEKQKAYRASVVEALEELHHKLQDKPDADEVAEVLDRFYDWVAKKHRL